MRFALTVCTGIALLAGSTALANPSRRSAGRAPRAFGFVENLGQWPEAIRFAAEGVTGIVGIEASALRFRHVEGDGDDGARSLDIRLRFEGARVDARPDAEEALLWVASYFRGRDSTRWVSEAPAFRQVVCEDIYDRIDLVVREGEAARGEIEYDLVLEPGADLGQVVVTCEGADALEVDHDGSLLVNAGGSVLRQSPPRTWEELPGGGRHAIACRYRLLGGVCFGFDVLGHRDDLRLVIDPIVAWSLPLGSSGAPLNLQAREGIWDMALTESGVLIAAGTKTAVDFPDEPPEGESCIEAAEAGGWYDAFVARIDAGTGAILSTTVIGGEREEAAIGVSVGSGGVIDIAGYTDSPDFPVTNDTPLAENPSGGRESGFDGFLVRLDAEGCGLLFSTYLGGRGEDAATGVTHLPDGHAVVFGYTAARDFPVTDGALMPTFRGGAYDAFLVRLDPERGAALNEAIVNSTYFGGNGNDAVDNTAIDYFIDRIYMGGIVSRVGASVVVFGGQTWSTDLPVTFDAFQSANAGSGDGYVALLSFPDQDSTRFTLHYLTYLGGSGLDGLDAVAVGPDDSIWIGGYTGSTGFPIRGPAFQTTHAGRGDGWVARIEPGPAGAGGLIYSSFLGGSALDWVNGLAVRADGRLTIAGETFSPMFQSPASSNALAAEKLVENDAYLCIVDPDPESSLERVNYLTFIGSLSPSSTGALEVSDSGRTFLGLQAASGPLAGVDDDTPFSNVGVVLALDLLIPEANIEEAGDLGACVEQGSAITLDASSSSTPPGSTLTGYEWRVGDEAPLQGASSLEFRFEENGIIPIRLTVTNDLGFRDSDEGFVCVRSPLESPELPAPWRAADIGIFHWTRPYFGVTSPAGDGGFRLVAGGRGLSVREDSGHLLFGEVEGDGAISARLEALAGGEPLATAGVMIRSGPGPGSPFAALVVEQGRLRFAYRDEPDAFRRRVSGPDVDLPVHLRVRRMSAPESSTSTLVGEFSSDGVAWTEVARVEMSLVEPPPPETPVAGVFAAAGASPLVPGYLALEVDVSDLRWTPASEFPIEPIFRRGDADDSGTIDITDPISLLGCLFQGGACPTCTDAADANDDSSVDITDPIFTLGFLFAGGRAPPLPYPDCGVDPTADDLDCAGVSGCE